MIATVELTCVQLPDEPTDAEIERTEDTRAMWQRAKTIADRFKASTRFAEHQDYGEACLFGDGYVYPSLDALEKMLDAFDKADIEYDNIDLPKGAPKDLVARLKKRYSLRRDVQVNEGKSLR
jgi:hypothetical protein